MRIPKTHTVVERSYFYYIVSKNHELEEENKRLQGQINEANSVICGLYHLTTDKKAVSGVVCDYLVKYGKPFEAESCV